jgi:sterol desaturase/sphingolipid hydroxylase (fatty acid hydroxylase superfamily)
MDPIVDYFSSVPPSHRTVGLVGGLALFWLIESAAPLFRFGYRKWQHAAINLFFTATTLLVNLSLAFLLLLVADWVTERRFGLLYLLPPLPTWLSAILGLMLLDFLSAWLPHWVQHRVPWLWRLHLIHHTDLHVDATTANRHHPGESVVRFAFTLWAVLLLGTPMWLVVLYQSLSVLLSQFNHANIRLPLAVDRLISWVIVSPDMHKVHHHYRLPYTDRNYGNIFSIWDRLLGTMAWLTREELVYGVEGHTQPREVSEVAGMLQLPFRRTR